MSSCLSLFIRSPCILLCPIFTLASIVISLNYFLTCITKSLCLYSIKASVLVTNTHIHIVRVTQRHIHTLSTKYKWNIVISLTSIVSLHFETVNLLLILTWSFTCSLFTVKDITWLLLLLFSLYSFFLL